MESKRKAGRAAAIILTSLLTACASAPKEAPKEALKPVQLGITQVGIDKAARYVYCDVNTCPRPTVKTALEPIRALPLPASNAQAKDEVPPERTADIGRSVDIPFPFNSSRMSRADKDKLVKAALASANAEVEVEIIARSDFVGPPKGQQKIVEARAKAMRSIVAKQTQGALFVERQEIARPDRVTGDMQSQQRRGTVRFIQPTNVSQKGESR